ncbi:hypothetical protein RPPS3_02450 [Rhodopseudomonas palustris]|uniref:hypothetical protein n=1 Tax=Rhodopseudomonas palustris TaxID=1076 RepID=UPI000D222FE4|nr:hypothetical protein [Rhodopseudomonas palustris]AVT74308.1 hypothetical protein RPPS3_02450 [Rhodopseudomonas palustris]
MRTWIGAAIVATALGVAGPAGATPVSTAQAPSVTAPGVTTSQATDISARQRKPHAKHRHVRRHAPPHRTYVYGPRGSYDYNARPHWYRPDPVSPFFPFSYGWGLGPSW